MSCIWLVLSKSAVRAMKPEIFEVVQQRYSIYLNENILAKIKKKRRNYVRRFISSLSFENQYTVSRRHRYPHFLSARPKPDIVTISVHFCKSASFA